MERNALIGGGAILVALVGVVGFYFLLSSGDSSDELPEYVRSKPQVEALRPGAAPSAAVGKPTAPAVNIKEDPLRAAGGRYVGVDMPERVALDPVKAKAWRDRRMKAIDNEHDKARVLVNKWLVTEQVASKHHTYIRDRVEEVYAAKRALTEEAEDGVITHRVARKRMEHERGRLREDLEGRVDEAQLDSLAQQFDKERIGAL